MPSAVARSLQPMIAIYSPPMRAAIALAAFAHLSMIRPILRMQTSPTGRPNRSLMALKLSMSIAPGLPCRSNRVRA